MKDLKYVIYTFYIPNSKIEEVQEFLASEGFLDYYIDQINNKSTLNVIFLQKHENAEILKKLNEMGLELLKTEISWERKWLKNFLETIKPFELIENVWINPDPAHELKLPEEYIVINIIPGTAFGTGLHPTTQMAAKLFWEVMRENDDVLDIGCGTGIISVIAKKRGAKKVVALDIDPLAVEKSKETMELNEVTFEIRHSDLLQAINENEKFDIIVSNIVTDVLIRLLKDSKLKKIMKENAHLILSGIDEAKENEMKYVIENQGFIIEKILRKFPWIAFLTKQSK